MLTAASAIEMRPSQRWVVRRKYLEEIRTPPAVVRELRDAIRSHERVTFLFAAHDVEHNNALALREFLEKEPS